MLRNNINATSLQQVLCGVITWTICARKKLEQHYGCLSQSAQQADFDTIKQQLIQALSRWQRSVWLDIFTCVSAQMVIKPQAYIRKRNLRAPLQDYLKLSFCLAGYITRNPKVAPLSFPVALRKVIQSCHCYGQSLLQPLLEYPGLILPGSAVISNKKETWLLLSHPDSDYLALKYDDASNGYSQEVTRLPAGDIAKVAAPGKLTNLRMIDKWWNNEWRSHQQQAESTNTRQLTAPGFRIDKPPTSLVEIIEHLNQQDIEVAKLSSLIENEPGFAQHIQETASQQSRSNLRIGNVKHGLLMNGFERTKSVLVQKALVTRLNQHSFPLQDAIYQFVKFWAAIASCIAQRHPKLLPEQASNWVYFCASGLFTNAEIKSCLYWQRDDPVDQPTGDTQQSPIAIKATEALWSHAHKLAVCWAQDRELISALKDIQAKQHLPATAQRSLPHVLLSLSLKMSINYFFSNASENSNNDVYLQQYMSKLALSPETQPQILQEAVENSHVYWPIHNQIKIQNG